MDMPFLGSEAMASGLLTRHRLRTHHRAVFPGVYLPNDVAPTLDARTMGAWLWSGRQGIISGSAASALHGSRWVDTDIPIEMVSSNTRPPAGLITRNDTLHEGESTTRRGIGVTSIARTGFDLGRRGPHVRAIARLDALCRATGLRVAAIADVAAQHPGARGARQLRKALRLVDPGAESPKETWLRLLLIRAGLPKPTTQIEVVDGDWVARLDMGWEELMVAVEYDGDQHRTDRRQYLRDIRRMERLQQLGWIIIRVVAEDRLDDILRRVVSALESRMSPRRG